MATSSTSSSTPEPTKDTKPKLVPGVDVSPEGVPYQASSRPREEMEAPGEPFDFKRPSGGAGLVEDEPTK